MAVGAIILGLAVAAPFYTANKGEKTGEAEFLPPSTHDMAQHLAVMGQFDMVLRSGALYPRWLPDFNRGYGSPWTNFYPTGFYYLTSAVNLLAGNWLLTLFLVSGLGLALSAMTFYMAARDLYGKWPAVAGALLYMLLPYHLVDLYWRGAMPEFMAFVLVPPVFYFGSRLASRARPQYVAAFALCYGALIVVHLPVSFLMAYALAFYAVVRAILYKDPRVLPRVAAGMVLGFSLSAIYLVPAVLESKDVYQPWTAIFPYDASYLKIFRPFDEFGEVVNLSFVGCFLVLAVGILIVAVRHSPNGQAGSPQDEDWVADRFGRGPGREVLLILIMGAATLFMCLPASRHIARLMPKIDVASFAWRWLAIASFFVCLAFVAALARLAPGLRLGRATTWCLTAGLAVVVGVNLWWSGHSIMARALTHPPLAVPDNYIDSGFTPKESTKPYDLPGHAPEAELAPANGFIGVQEWLPSRRRLTVAATLPCDLRMRSYTFPGWTAEVDGKPAEIIGDKMGTQTIPLAPGNHTIEVDFDNTPPRSLGLAISGIAVAIISALLAIPRLRRGAARFT